MTTASSRPRRWKHRRAAFILACVIGLAITSCGYWTQHRNEATPITEQVTRGHIEQFISATGKLEPKQYVEVGAQVSGLIKRLYVDEGSQVKAGQLVADIDATVFETRVQNAEASLEGKQAQRRQLEAELELAELRAQRNSRLHQQNAVSEDVLLESRANVKILRAQISAMTSQIKADTASLAGDKATLSYAKIYAPINGTVVGVYVREGQTINANQSAPLLLKIADLSVLTLRAEVSEADINKLSVGMPAYFKTFGGGKRQWHSNLRQILPTPTVVNDVVLYQALIDINNTDQQLMDAMTTQIFFVLEQADDALLVPLSAIQRNKKVTEVTLATASGYQNIAVKIGVKNRTHAQILSGLNEGDRVVLSGSGANSRATNASSLVNPTVGARRGF